MGIFCFQAPYFCRLYGKPETKIDLLLIGGNLELNQGLCLTFELDFFRCLTSFVRRYRNNFGSSQKYFDENQSKLFKIETVVNLHLTFLTHDQMSFDVLSFLLCWIFFLCFLDFWAPSDWDDREWTPTASTRAEPPFCSCSSSSMRWAKSGSLTHHSSHLGTTWLCGLVG